MPFVQKNKALLLLCITILLALFFTGGCGGGTPKQQADTAKSAKPIEWKILSSWGPEEREVYEFLIPFVEELNKKAEGRLKVSWFGPESVPPFEQFKPVVDGVFDALFTNGAYHMGEIAVGSMIEMGVCKSLQQAKELGLVDLVAEAYEKKGLKLITPVQSGGYHIILRNKKIDKADLTGLKIRATPLYQTMIERLGGATVNAPASEIYTLLEKGVVDGACWPASDAIKYKWNEVARYQVRPKFGQVYYPLFASLKTWNKLPPDLQKLIMDTADAMSTEVRDRLVKGQEEEEKKLVEMGMEVISLPPEEGKKLVEAFYRGNWEKLFAGKDVEYGQKIKAITDTLPHGWL